MWTDRPATLDCRFWIVLCGWLLVVACPVWMVLCVLAAWLVFHCVRSLCVAV